MKEESVLAGSMDEKGLSRWVGADRVNRREHTQGMPSRGNVPKRRCGGAGVQRPEGAEFRGSKGGF